MKDDGKMYRHLGSFASEAEAKDYAFTYGRLNPEIQRQIAVVSYNAQARQNNGR